MRDDSNVLSLCSEVTDPYAEYVVERLEWDSFEVVSGEYIKEMDEALKTDDPWNAVRVMVRAEQIMRFYVTIGGNRSLHSNDICKTLFIWCTE